MKAKMFLGVIFALLVLGCCFVHRKVIMSLIKGEPMPKSPKWHCLIPEEGRRD